MGFIVLTNIITLPLLISSGVLGYLTLYILIKTGKVNTNDSKENVYILTFISFLNFLIMWVTYLGLSLIPGIQEQWSLIISLVIILIFSSVVAYLIPVKWMNIVETLFNNQRQLIGKAKQSSKTVRQHFFDRNEWMIVYIFDFDNNAITREYSKWANEKNDDPLELILEPFSETPPINTHSEVIEHIEREDVKSEIFISVDKRVKIYYIYQ